MGEEALNHEGQTTRNGDFLKNEIKDKLIALAEDRSIPFCYSCYKNAPTGKCSSCGSDDLMRLLPNVGCEYGTKWIVQHILETEFKTVDLEEVFEQSIQGIYPETTQVGWMTFDTIELMKSNDPISWQIAISEWASQEEEEENLITFDNGSNYYDYYQFDKF